MDMVNIDGYENYLFDLRCDAVLSLKNNKYLKAMRNNKGYSYVSLYKNKKRKNILLHRLIFKSHNLDKMIDGLCVDHIDRNINNNSLNNLRACSFSQNNCNRRKIKSVKFKNIQILKTKFNVLINFEKKTYKKSFNNLIDALLWRDENLINIHKDFFSFG
jgi:hypothetical protein